MKKIFKLADSKKHEDRVLESIKHNIRKYAKREKKKNLPDKATMYWGFDCKIGATKEQAKTVEYAELIKALDTVKSTEASEVYIEILAKIVDKPLKSEEPVENEDNNIAP
ncbi:MAG: hypothetical protein HF962_01945 [Sulfurovum sp.]|nr:hypothetical protein [Sulfurovum sp.]